MKLYFFPGACSLAPHIALREIDLPFELIKVDPASKKTADGQDYLRVSPNGYVPALALDNGRVLTEAAVILQYIADQKPAAQLIPACGALERYQVQMQLNFVSTELHKTISPLFSPDTPDIYKESLKKKLADRLGHLDRQLGAQQYLAGAQYGVADIYLYVVTGWLPHFKIDLAQWPALKAWRERVGARPAVQAAKSAEKQ